MLRSLGATFGNVLIVSAKPEWLFYGAMGQIVLAGAVLILGVAKFGITGVAVTMTVALIFGIVLNGVIVSRILRLGAGDWIRIVGVPLLLSLVFIGGVRLVLPGNSGTWLVVKICVAIGLYIAAAYLRYRQEIDGMIHEVSAMGKGWMIRTRRQ
jgi:hypothetical protein